MKWKTFFIIFEGLSFGEKIKISQKIADTSFKEATSFENLYVLTKIHRRLANVPGRPVISNCSTPTEKVCEYMDFLLKPIMQDGRSYIKDTGDFLKKLKHIGKIPEQQT